MKRFADRKRQPHQLFKAGDSVWLIRDGIRSTQPCEKLSERKIGPFIVKRQINSVAYELQLPEHLRIHTIFHCSLLEPYVYSNIQDRPRLEPPPIAIDNDNQPLYEVEAITDARCFRRELQYIIHWKGYPECERTWEPAKALIQSATPIFGFGEFSLRTPKQTGTSF
jgi:hypothetical protein